MPLGRLVIFGEAAVAAGSHSRANQARLGGWRLEARHPSGRKRRRLAGAAAPLAIATGEGKIAELSGPGLCPSTISVFARGVLFWIFCCGVVRGRVCTAGMWWQRPLQGLAQVQESGGARGEAR